MRLLYVIHRYGADIAGGAEAHCRAFATRLVERGHHVEVATTCATSYVDWANVLPPGDVDDHGVVVHRFPTDRQRDHEPFAALSSRVLAGRFAAPYEVQEAWMRAQGPLAGDLARWVAAHAARFDAVILFTYLYATAWQAAPAVAGRAPLLLHPTAHDEPPLRLAVVRPVFHLADGFAFSTPEEEALVRSRFGVGQPGAVIGIGTELAPEAPSDDAIAAFRSAHGLGAEPYLLCLGRVDPNKGTVELLDWFAHYRRRRHSAVRLVLVGEQAHAVRLPAGVVATGVVDEPTKAAALAGALALVNPSWFESFSMVLAEAWALRRPVLVQGRSDVLAGQVRRSGGGLAYHGFAEFEAAIDLLVGDPDLGHRLGEAGWAYVDATFRWDVVLGRYESLLRTVIADTPVTPAISVTPH